MAMTKKEQARVEQLLTDAALRRTAGAEPDVMPPKDYREVVNGWHFNEYSREAYKACTSSNYHAIRAWDKTNSQGSLALFSSRMLALRALRAEMENRFARELRDVDKRIEQEEAESNV